MECDSDEGTEVDPIKMIMEQLGNRMIILKVNGQVYIPQEILNKSINLLIRTRIFENYKEVVKCHDCSALVYEGLLPKIRIDEGLNMKPWKCIDKKCSYINLEETSLLCKKCKTPRP